MTGTTPNQRPAQKFALIGGVAAIVLAIGLYGIARSGGKTSQFAGACPLSQAAAAKAGPLAHGEVAAFNTANRDTPLSDIAFKGPDGAPTTVAAFKGKTVLLNLWATWCIPCREEMPALAKLQTALGSKDFSVVAVNIDTARLDRPKAFLKEINATALSFYADPTADILQQLKRSEKIQGLPTTILIGPDGCEIGMMEGPAVWDSPDAQSLIKQVQGT
ncbi:MAG: TlpA disulfide reductase family protein [Beijerinckiaceae bacterium]|nr:TlpA disulfide reductase family protein [Beijerinckiaceae bacterium]